MPPKKKVKVEDKDKEDGEDGKGEGADQGGSGDGSVPVPHLSQQQVVGGPEAPKLDLGEGVEIFTYAPGKQLENLTAGKLIRVEVYSPPCGWPSGNRKGWQRREDRARDKGAPSA